MTEPERPAAEAAPQPDFYLEDGRVVFTATYHVRRGVCCGSGCRHCPYEPPHVEGCRRLAR